MVSSINAPVICVFNVCIWQSDREIAQTLPSGKNTVFKEFTNKTKTFRGEKGKDSCHTTKKTGELKFRVQLSGSLQ